MGLRGVVSTKYHNCLLLYLVLVGTLFMVSGNNNLKILRQRPKPMPNFILEKYLGQWFFVFRKPPCGWPGSDEFEDYQVLATRSPRGMNYDLYMRVNGECSNLKVAMECSVKNPAEFIFYDKVGRLISGENVLLATDYNTFAIFWSCKGGTINGWCDDPFLSVQTRSPRPTKAVLKMINVFLMKSLGITVSNLPYINHNAPCAHPLPLKKKSLA